MRHLSHGRQTLLPTTGPSYPSTAECYPEVTGIIPVLLLSSLLKDYNLDAYWQDGLHIN